ncbi:hypothetical protein WICMUC_005847 [Wickerhamomyces mucosus]|uniref:Tubulin-specific chaperone A n=1 Tax=Wickerhamomyces mucosus TaxID=1378264 RepID=A0A9P8P433_9ASCO|nr:hypothetical protein WICMUC_005847 [Wickerhamomyces mucosus]
MAPTQLEIKTKALGRLVKEESLYQEELKQQDDHINFLKSNNGDEYEIKKQIQVLDDTKKVIKEVLKKIKESKDSLESFLETYTGDEDLNLSKQNIANANKLF